VRVEKDQSKESSYWNAPVNSETNRFVFVPICDRYNNSEYLEGDKRLYRNAVPKGPGGL